MTEENQHQPVLLSEALEGLSIQPSGIYIDGTFGRGGHSQHILGQLNAYGYLYAIDQDPDAVRFAQQIKDPRFHIEHSSFIDIADYAKKMNIAGNIDGILLDLGVSSPQLDVAERGFSFRFDGPLDMRMNPTSGISLGEWLVDVKESTLSEIIKTYGEERYANKIAKAIVHANKQMAITTTKQLADIVAKAHPAWKKDRHPATKTFQALRIMLNQELEALQAVLPQCLNLLKVGGRLAVISFHSLEDRIVKHFMQKEMQGDLLLKGLPIPDCQLKVRVRSVGRKIRPSSQEVKNNPRARSAVLRIMEKIR